MVRKVNRVLEKVASDDITATNNLLYAGAAVVTENLGARKKPGNKQKEPMWKQATIGKPSAGT